MKSALFFFARFAGPLVLAIVLNGCGTARVASPAAIYGSITPDEYAEAEAHFGGPIPLVVYWDDARCQQLLNRRDAIVIVAAGLGGLTGAGGLATALPEDATRAERMGWGLTTAALAATGTALALAARTLSDRFAKNCRVERDEYAPTSDEFAPMPDELQTDGGAP